MHGANGLVFLLLIVGCSDKRGNWEESRAAYCDQVSILRIEVARALEGWVERFRQIPDKDPKDRDMYCADATRNLSRLEAKLQGFHDGATVLGFGRPNDSIDRSGLSLNFGSSPITSFLANPVCHEIEHRAHDVALALKAASSRSLSELDDALSNCRSVGWTPSKALTP